MDLEPRYFDRDGNPKNILQLVKLEPEWAANRIQAGEKAARQRDATNRPLQSCEKNMG
jgi:hypothetical protein